MSYLSRRCREIREEEEHRDGKWYVGIDYAFGDKSYWYWDRIKFADTRLALDYPYSWRGRGG
jgi:hypothetical protein